MKITDKKSFEVLAKKLLSLTDDKENRKVYIFRDKMIVRTENFFISHQGENYCETEEDDEAIVIDEEMNNITDKTSGFENFYYDDIKTYATLQPDSSEDFILDFGDKTIPTVLESTELYIRLKNQPLFVQDEDCYSEYDVIRNINNPHEIMEFWVPALPTLKIVDFAPNHKVRFGIFPQPSENLCILKFALNNGYRGFIRGKGLEYYSNFGK